MDILHNQNSICKKALTLCIITSIIALHWAQGQNLRSKFDEKKIEFVSGEILVKFKPTPEIRRSLQRFEEANTLQKSGMQKLQNAKVPSKDSAITMGIPSIDQLYRTHRVSEMEKVFRTAKLPETDGTIMLKSKRKKVPDLTTIYKLSFFKDADILKIIEDCKTDPNIEFAEPNYIYHTDETIPSEYANRTALKNAQWALDKIQAPEAWDIETGDSSVIIAIIDTGVDWDHPDLAANIWTNPGEDPWSDPNDPSTGNGIDDDGNGYVDDWKGWDFVTSDSEAVYPGEDPGPPDNNPMDFYGHGTTMAGIAAGATNNMQGIAGVTWNCKIMSIRAGCKNNWGDGETAITWFVPAIVYAADNGAKVINMSFGGQSYLVPQTIKEAVDYADSLGVVCVAAAGNNYSSKLTYPAAFENVIAVGATDEYDTRASYSNYGSWIDVTAPGTGILITDFDNSYNTKYGTSCSCAIVVGIAALILSKNPALNVKEVTQILQTSSDDIGDPGWDIYTGYGRVNAFNALKINTICTASIDTPLKESVVRGTLNFAGNAFGSDFDHYTLEWGYGESPNSWSSNGVTLINDGISPIINGTVASLNLDGLDQWEFSVRLHVFDKHENVSHFRRIFFNGNLMLEGWPVKIIGVPNGGGTNGAVVTDIDGDGDKEVVVGTRNGGSSNILHHDGSMLSGWPNGGDWSQTPPSVGDVDGDGYLEIVPAADGGYLAVNRHDGSLNAGWPVLLGGQIIQSPALADVDYDGRLELFYGWGDASGNGKVYGFRCDGTSLPGWPITLGDRAYNGPSIGDIDGDGDLEILLGAWDKKVYAWHHDGTPVNGWPVSLPDIPAVPSLADVNGDGKLEVFTAALAWPYITHLYGWTHNGLSLSGWPIEGYGNSEEGPAIGDIDGDGDIEIIFGVVDATISPTAVYALHHDGTLVNGWPTTIPSTGFVSRTSQPMIGDIDGDGSVEALAGVTNDNVYAWKNNGTLVYSWPRELNAYPSKPTLADVDGDGFIDIIAGGDNPNLYIWKTLKTYDPSKVPWYTYRHDDYHTSWYGFENIKPQAITNLAASEIGNDTILHWSPITKDVKGNPESLRFYKVYRGTTYNFVPSVDNLIGTTTDTTFTDSCGNIGSYCYVVRALDKYCNLSNVSNRVMPGGQPVPVEMDEFAASCNRLNVELHWKTATEVSNYGFELERRTVKSDPTTLTAGKQLSVSGEQWSKVGFVSGSGTSNSPKEYSFTDKHLSPAHYAYRIKQIDQNGTFKYSQSVEVKVGIVPKMLTLSQNYPNPFNPITTIEFTLAEDGKILLKVFDMLGREVATLVNGELKAGLLHRTTLDVSKLSSGIYLYRLQSGDKSLVMKLLVLK